LIHANFSISGYRMAALLDGLAQAHSLPTAIVMDYGPENPSDAMRKWLHQPGIQLMLYAAWKPHSKCLYQVLHRKVRDTCPNDIGFQSLPEARCAIEAWRKHYSDRRLHSSLGLFVASRIHCLPNQPV
jgi:putative transposase